jgi:hypothetical protein
VMLGLVGFFPQLGIEEGKLGLKLGWGIISTFCDEGAQSEGGLKMTLLWD